MSGLNTFAGSAVALSVMVERLQEIRAAVRKLEPDSEAQKLADDLDDLLGLAVHCEENCRHLANPQPAVAAFPHGRWSTHGRGTR